MSIRSYRDLEVWKKAMDLVTESLSIVYGSLLGRMLNGLRRSLEKKRNEVQNE